MLKIAYCDDMEQDRNNILLALSQIEDKWQDEFEIAGFKSGEDLCSNLKENSYDIILLDIVMKGIDGIETAKIIKSMDTNSFVIFISSYDKRLKEMFGFKTLAFLDKPLEVSQLENALNEAYNIMKKDENNIFVYTKNKVQKYVYFNDIIYMESVNHRVEVLTKKEKIVINETLKNIWNTLKTNDNFIMPNRSYIINLRYSFMESSSTFNVTNCNLIVSVGRTMKEETKQRYLNFIRRNKQL